MKPPPFDYHRAQTQDEAVKSLMDHGTDVRVMAGGKSLIAMLNMRLTQPKIILDISGIHELNYQTKSSSYLSFGASVTQAQALNNSQVVSEVPLLGQALPYVGHMQTRNRGTICGSICHADPSSEIPLVLATLGGEIVVRSETGQRVIPIQDFQIGLMTSAKRPDELVVSARFPVARPEQRFSFTEIARRHGDFAIVAIACCCDGKTTRIGVGGVADTPAVREWPCLEPDQIDDALNELAWDLGGYDDIHASARYRRELIRKLGRDQIGRVQNDQN